MKKYLFLALFMSFCCSISFAQTNIEAAQKEALNARRAFEDGKYTQALNGFKKVDDLLAPSITSYYFQTLCNYHLKDYIAAKESMDIFFIFEPSGNMYDEIKKISGTINREYEKIIKEKNDYEYAVKSDNPEIKISFLNIYPNSVHKKTITDQLDVLLWAKARETNDVSDYEKYVNNLPYGRNVNKAYEFIGFKKAMRANTIRDFEDFKKKYPRADSIRIVDQKLQGAYLHHAELNLKNKNYNAAINFCNSYISTYPYGSDVNKVKDVLQASYYYIGEGHRASKNEASAKTNYTNAMNVKKTGTYYTKSHERMEEYRLNALRIEKQGYYDKAVRHRKYANQQLGVGFLWLGIGGLGVWGGIDLLSNAGEFDTTSEILGAVAIGAGIGLAIGSFRNFSNSSNARQSYRIERRKYKRINVAYAPYYDYKHNTVGLTLNINF
jgi:hypothetical protein